MTTLPSIALLHYTLPPTVGGVESVIQAQARTFTQAGYSVSLIAGSGQPDAIPWHNELMLIPEMDTRHPEIVQMNETLEKGEVPESFTPMVEKLIDSLHAVLMRFDHVIIHNVLTKHLNLPLTAALLHLIEKKSIHHAIAWCHDFSWTSSASREKLSSGYPWDLLRKAVQDITYVTVSERRQQELARLLNIAPETIHLAYNGVEPATLLGLSTEGLALIEHLDLFNSDLILLMPVRITRAKNIEYALNVLERLKKHCRSPRLVITGPPDPHNPESMQYFQSLLALRDRLSVQRETGFVFESDPEAGAPYMIPDTIVGELIRVSDVVFMPSHREGFGMPVLEAGLAGIPVVSTGSVPASVEIGKEDVFVFSSTLHPQELAAKILLLVNDNPVSRFRRRIRKNYLWQTLFHHSIEPLLMTEKRPA